jgi:hypothetical protein
MHKSTSVLGPQAVSVDEQIAEPFADFAGFVEGVVFYTVDVGGAPLPLIVV